MEQISFHPFASSIQNVFATMLQIPVVVKEPRQKTCSSSTFEVSGIIGISGEVVGNVVLSMGTQTAEKIVSIFGGAPLTANSPDFADALGELINMVAGGAKAKFKNRTASISCPTVVLGMHTIARPTGVPIVVIPCHTDCGELAIEVSLKDVAAHKNAGAALAGVPAA